MADADRTALGSCCALLLLLASPQRAAAASVEGMLGFPSDYVPAMQIYAREVDTSRIHSLHTQADQTAFRFELPAGRYVFFAMPDEPGAPQIYGAHTSMSDCRARTPKAECADHTLAVVALTSRTRLTALRLDDWYLPDAVADELDRILGISASPTADELGAPHFSEYPIAELEPPPAPTIESVAADLAAEQRAALAQAFSSGPNFAGRVSVFTTACGPGCTQPWLFDWRRGAIVGAGVLPRISAPLPCRREEALRYRRDSRLLSLTEMRGTSVATRYFVWQPESGSLTQTAEYQRTPERFCATARP